MTRRAKKVDSKNAAYVLCDMLEAVNRAKASMPEGGSIVLEGYELVVGRPGDGMPVRVDLSNDGEGDEKVVWELKICRCTLRLHVPLGIYSGISERLSDSEMLPRLEISSVKEVGSREGTYRFIDLTGVFGEVELEDVDIGEVRFDAYCEGGCYVRELILKNCVLGSLAAYSDEMDYPDVGDNDSIVIEHLIWHGGQVGRIAWSVNPCIVKGYEHIEQILLPPPRVTEFVSVNNRFWFDFFRGLCPTTPVRFCGNVANLKG